VLLPTDFSDLSHKVLRLRGGTGAKAWCEPARRASRRNRLRCPWKSLPEGSFERCKILSQKEDDNAQPGSCETEFSAGAHSEEDHKRIKRHYCIMPDDINPTRIVPIGPALDLTRPNGRGQMQARGNRDRASDGGGSDNICMKTNSQTPIGKISADQTELGVPTRRMVEERARELARLDERNPNEFTEADWEQACAELTGVPTAEPPQDASEIAASLSAAPFREKRAAGPRA
jgi:hypothetical protein